MNNDNLAILVGIATSLMLVRSIMRGVTLGRTVAIGLLLGLGLLTKSTVLIFIPVSMFVLLIAGLPRLVPTAGGGDRRRAWALSAGRFLARRLVYVFVASGLCLVVGGWWLLRNKLVYGDLFGNKAVMAMAQQVFPSHILNVDIANPKVQLLELIFTVDTHLGWLAFTSIRLPPALYIAYYALLLMGLFGLIVGVIQRRVRGRTAACLFLGLLVAGLIYVSMYYHASWWGRFLFPALALTSLCLIWGTYSWLRIFLRSRSSHAVAMTAAGIWIVFLAFADVYSLFGVFVPGFYAGQ